MISFVHRAVLQSIGKILEQWLKPLRKEMDRKATAVRTALPFVGVMPAPAYITRSPIQSKIADLYHLRTGNRTKPFGTQEKDAEKRKAKNASTMDIYMFKRLPLSDRNTLRQKMSKAEKLRYSD